MPRHPLPDDFLWGAATSSHQIEGAVHEDGRGESIWARFAATPGRIEDGSDARVACDHFHRWRDDIQQMKSLGIKAYRFSIAWSRVMPSGRGPINEAGLDFYDRLVDGLIAAGIQPFVTLYHWDLPQALQDEGGWAERSTALAFAEYADVVSRRLTHRVRHWTTHNEPWCIATLGHEEGHHAPGHRDPAETLRVAHHLLLSHGWAAARVRQNIPDAEVGIVLNLTPAMPATPSPADQDAARWFDGFFNRWYLDPLFRGRYPEDAIRDRMARGHLAGIDLPFVQEGDMAVIATPLDYLGINYYSRVVMRADASGRPEAVPMVPTEELTEMGWEVYPAGLHDLLVRIHREYQPPKIYITENGAAFDDRADAEGLIHDTRRIDFLRGHLLAAQRAIASGVPLRGYFAWSLLDNFEWAHGFTKRFGLLHVDYDTQVRTWKNSAFWYRDVVAANAVDDASDRKQEVLSSRRFS